MADFAYPRTITSTTTGTLSGNNSWVTFLNSGAGACTITFDGTSMSFSLPANNSLTLPNIGRPYGDISFNATGTTLVIIYMA